MIVAIRRVAKRIKALEVDIKMTSYMIKSFLVNVHNQIIQCGNDYQSVTALVLVKYKYFLIILK